MIIFLTCVLAVLAMAASIWPPKQKTSKSWVFAAFSLLAGALMILQELNERETKLSLLGDPDNPPYFDLTRSVPPGQAVISNPSSYPAYGVSIDVAIRGRSDVSTFSLPEIPPNSSPRLHPFGLGGEGFALDIAIHSRGGSYREQLMMSPLGQDKWARALRVLGTSIQMIDSDFPRSADGKVVWPTN